LLCCDSIWCLINAFQHCWLLLQFLSQLFVDYCHIWYFPMVNCCFYYTVGSLSYCKWWCCLCYHQFIVHFKISYYLLLCHCHWLLCCFPLMAVVASDPQLLLHLLLLSWHMMPIAVTVTINASWIISLLQSLYCSLCCCHHHWSRAAVEATAWLLFIVGWPSFQIFIIFMAQLQ